MTVRLEVRVLSGANHLNAKGAGVQRFVNLHRLVEMGTILKRRKRRMKRLMWILSRRTVEVGAIKAIDDCMSPVWCCWL